MGSIAKALGAGAGAGLGNVVANALRAFGIVDDTQGAAVAEVLNYVFPILGGFLGAYLPTNR